jgi:cytochrome c-550 PedF
MEVVFVSTSNNRNSMFQHTTVLLRRLLVAAAVAAPLALFAHGDVVPQAVDTHTLPQLGEKLLDANPYSQGIAAAPVYEEAKRIGSSAYNQNCARCHGLEAISGGIAPDLRKLDRDCTGLTDAKKKQECFGEMQEYFIATVRAGRVRDGRVYMPPFKDVFTQEAIWSIKTYLESRRTNEE